MVVSTTAREPVLLVKTGRERIVCPLDSGWGSSRELENSEQCVVIGTFSPAWPPTHTVDVSVTVPGTIQDVPSTVPGAENSVLPS